VNTAAIGLMLSALLVLGADTSALAAPGDVIWEQTYGGAGTEVGTHVSTVPDGGYVVCGDTESGAATHIVRTDSAGDSLWHRT